jgi:hypothetical protein
MIAMARLGMKTESIIISILNQNFRFFFRLR